MKLWAIKLAHIEYSTNISHSQMTDHITRYISTHFKHAKKVGHRLFNIRFI